MADNTQLNAMSGGDTVATDDVSGIKHQLMKVEYGADGAATRVTSSTPLPTTSDGTTEMNRLENLLIALRQLLSGPAGQLPDALGRGRVSVDAMAAGLILGTVNTVSTVTSVTTVVTVSNVTSVANVAKVSALGATAVPADMLALGQSNMAALELRRQIAVS